MLIRIANAQYNQSTPVTGSESSTLVGTNRVGGAIKAGNTNQVSERKNGFYLVPEGVSSYAEVRTNSTGGIVIRETRFNSTTVVSPTENGGVIVRGPNNTRFVVTPQGIVQSDGRKNRYINVTTSSDGKSVTIWGRGGILYTIPFSGN